MSRFFRFSYLAHHEEGRPLPPFRLRDGGAFQELSEIVSKQGFSYEGLILNYPVIPWLDEEDILNWEAFRNRLGTFNDAAGGNGDCLGRGAGLAKSLTPADDKKKVIEELNSLVRNPRFYETIERSQLKLSAEAEALIGEEKVLLEKERQRLNRLILEAIFPEIARSHDTSGEVPHLKPSDLLVMTTRPPLNDDRVLGRKVVSRSHNPLENKVFSIVKNYLEHCSRGRVSLTSYWQNRLPAPFGSLANLEFQTHGGSAKITTRLPALRPANGDLTATYLLYVPGQDNHPALLCSFGLGGTEGLVFSYLLRKRYGHTFLKLEDSPRFLMGLIETKNYPKRPLTLSFADDWRMTLLDFSPADNEFKIMNR
jgi:hypothetical protein